MWIYDDDAEEWRFLVASEDVRKRGPQAAYLRVRNLLKNARLLDRLPLRRVVIADPSHPLLSIVSTVGQTSGNELAGWSFYDCTFNGITVPGMHIYHLIGDPANAAATSKAVNAAATGH
jgi:hypothetical protein